MLLMLLETKRASNEETVKLKGEKRKQQQSQLKSSSQVTGWTSRLSSADATAEPNADLPEALRASISQSSESILLVKVLCEH